MIPHNCVTEAQLKAADQAVGREPDKVREYLAKTVHIRNRLTAAQRLRWARAESTSPPDFRAAMWVRANETGYCVLLDFLPDEELVPESAVGPLVLLPELLFPAVLPLFGSVLPPPAGLEVDPGEFAVDPDGLDEFDDAALPALDDPDWLAWLFRSVHAAKPKMVATTAAEIT